MKKIFFISLIIISFSCSKTEQEDSEIDRSQGLIYSPCVSISYLDSEGNDLLNPNSKNYISLDSIKLYWVVNGDKFEYHNSMMDNPVGLWLNERTKPFTISVFTNTETDIAEITEDDVKIGEKATAILNLNKQIVDTLISQWQTNPGGWSIYIGKLWINGELQQDTVPPTRIVNLD